MGIKVSVIMPSLNVASYIGECLQSVVSQTLREIEILCIDAGSTDGTLEIIREFAGKDDRVKVVCSEKKSYGYQLNLGIQCAAGEYISIVETDDIACQDMLESLYDCTLGQKPDYVKGTAVNLYRIKECNLEVIPIIPYFGLDETEDCSRISVDPSLDAAVFVADNFLWGGIYRADFLKGIRFRETQGAAFQDISALFRIISTARTAVYLNQKVYLYRQDNERASSYNKNSFDFMDGEYEYIADNYLDGMPEDWVRAYYKKLFLLMLNRFDAMAYSGMFWEGAVDAIDRIAQRVKYAFGNGFLSIREMGETAFLRASLAAESPRALLKIDRALLEVKAAYFRKLKEFIGQDRVILFGCGKRGKYIADLLRIHYGMDIECYWDNDAGKYGTCRDGIPVRKPGEGMEKDCKVVVTAAAGTRKRMMEQLEELGIEINRVFEGQLEVMDDKLYHAHNIF